MSSCTFDRVTHRKRTITLLLIQRVHNRWGGLLCAVNIAMAEIDSL